MANKNPWYNLEYVYFAFFGSNYTNRIKNKNKKINT